MRIRLLGAPWWLRGLILGGAAALLLVLLTPWLLPETIDYLSWGWRATLLTVVSGAFGALFAALSEPGHRAYRAAAVGLGPADRARTVAAIRRGVVPGDAAVLAAAARLGTWVERAVVSRRQRAARWLFVVVGAGLGIYYLVSGYRHTGVVWCANALAMAVLLGWGRYRRPRIRAHVAAVRAAAADLPGGLEGVMAAAPQLPVRLRRSARAALYAAAIGVMLAAGVVLQVWGRPSADCRTARAVVVYIDAQRDMFNMDLITAPTGGPALSDYSAWATRLDRYASDTSAPEVAPRLRRIAELAAQAADLARDARSDPADAAGDIRSYGQLLIQITDAEREVLDACRIRYS